MKTRHFKNIVKENGISLSFLCVWMGLIVTFVLYLSPDVVSRDQWRFLPMVENYFTGVFSWNDLYRGQTHVKPVYMAIFLLNSVYLGLDLLLETLLGITALFAATIIIYLNYKRSFSFSPDGLYSQLSFLLVAMVFLSFHQFHNYSYSLLSLAGYAGLLMMVLILSVFNSCLISGLNKKRLIFLSIFIIAGSLSFLGGRSLAVLAAMLVALAVHVLSDKENNAKPSAILTTLVVISFVVAQYVYWLISPAGSQVSEGLPYVLDHLSGSMQFVLTALANSLVDVKLLIRKFGLAWSHITAIGGVVSLLYLGACYLYWKQKLYRRTYLPLLLIFYTLAFIGEILIVRYGLKGLGVSAAPRYVFNLQLGLAGVIWIYCLTYAHIRQQSRNSNKWKTLAIVVLSISIVSIEMKHLHLGFKVLPFHKKAIDSARQQVLNSDFSKGRWLCPNETICSEGVLILKKYKLNVFREQ